MPETKRAVLVIEALPPMQQSVLKQALSDVEQLIRKYCNATTRVGILDKNNNTMSLD